MDVLYRLGEASVSETLVYLADDPSYDTVRITLGILEKKQYVTHRKEGNRYVYRPTIPAEEATDSAMKHIVNTFFGGSMPKTVLALLGTSEDPLSESDLNEIEAWVAEARKKHEH